MTSGARTQLLGQQASGPDPHQARPRKRCRCGEAAGGEIALRQAPARVTRRVPDPARHRDAAGIIAARVMRDSHRRRSVFDPAGEQPALKQLDENVAPIASPVAMEVAVAECQRRAAAKMYRAPAALPVARAVCSTEPRGDLGRDHATSASEVLRIGGPRRDSAQSSASRHLYRGRAPNLRNGGPPPRVALVARFFGATGKPAAVSAAAVASRVNRASRSGTTRGHHDVCARVRAVALAPV